jgi:hypothetical protein
MMAAATAGLDGPPDRASRWDPIGPSATTADTDESRKARFSARVTPAAVPSPEMDGSSVSSPGRKNARSSRRNASTSGWIRGASRSRTTAMRGARACAPSGGVSTDAAVTTPVSALVHPACRAKAYSRAIERRGKFICRSWLRLPWGPVRPASSRPRHVRLTAIASARCSTGASLLTGPADSAGTASRRPC